METTHNPYVSICIVSGTELLSVRTPSCRSFDWKYFVRVRTMLPYMCPTEHSWFLPVVTSYLTQPRIPCSPVNDPSTSFPWVSFLLVYMFRCHVLTTCFDVTYSLRLLWGSSNNLGDPNLPYCLTILRSLEYSKYLLECQSWNKTSTTSSVLKSLQKFYYPYNSISVWFFKRENSHGKVQKVI